MSEALKRIDQLRRSAEEIAARGNSEDKRRQLADNERERLALIKQVIALHPVSQLSARSGLSRQKIYRNVDVPPKPFGPGLREDQFARRIEQIRGFRDTNGRLPQYREDRSLNRWLAKIRAAVAGKHQPGAILITDQRLRALDEVAPEWREAV